MNKPLYVTAFDNTVVPYIPRKIALCVQCDQQVRLELFGKRPARCSSCNHAAPTDGKGGRLRAEIRTVDLTYTATVKNGVLKVVSSQGVEDVYHDGMWLAFGYVNPRTVTDRDEAKELANV